MRWILARASTSPRWTIGQSFLVSFLPSGCTRHRWVNPRCITVRAWQDAIGGNDLSIRAHVNNNALRAGPRENRRQHHRERQRLSLSLYLSPKHVGAMNEGQS